MAAINANIVVETTTLTLSPSTTSIGVTVDPINLNVNTTEQGVPSKIANGTSNVDIATANGNITMSVGGTANVITATTTGANIQSNLSLEGANANITFTPDTTTVDGNTYSTVVRSNVNSGSSIAFVSEDYAGFSFNTIQSYANTTSGNIAEGASISLDLNDAIGNSNTNPKVQSTVNFSAYGPNSNLASNSTTTRTSLEMGGAAGGFSTMTGSSLGTGFGQASWKQFQYQPGAMSFWRRNGNGEARTGLVANDRTTIEFIPASNNGSGSTTWASEPSHIAGKVDASFSGANNAVAPIGLEFQVAGNAGSYDKYYHEMYANGDTTFNSSGGGTPITLGYNGIITGDGGNLSNITGANVSGEVSFAQVANSVAGANVSGEVTFAATANSVALANVAGAGNIATVNLDGNVANYLTGTGTWVPVSSGNSSQIANGSSNISIPVINSDLQFFTSGFNVANVSAGGGFFPAEWTFNGNITVANVLTGNLGAFQNLTLASSNVRLGAGAGQNSQGSDSVAIGKNAGLQSQAGFGVAVGNGAGQYNQLSEGVAVGHNAGQNDQGSFALGLGSSAGGTNQGNRSVAIGFAAGFNNQGIDSVAIGHNAGEQNQGSRAVAIGQRAGATSQHAGSIVINATSANLDSTAIDTFTVKPIRNAGASGLPTGFVQMAYNPTTGEIVYYT